MSDRETAERPDPNGCKFCGRAACPAIASRAKADREEWLPSDARALLDCTARPLVDWQAECRALTAARSPSPPALVEAARNLLAYIGEREVSHCIHHPPCDEPGNALRRDNFCAWCDRIAALRAALDKEPK